MPIENVDNFKGELINLINSMESDLSSISVSVNFSGSYNDLTDQPTLGTAADNDEEDFATAAQGLLADSAVQQINISSFVPSDTAQAGGGTSIRNAVAIAEQEYDAITTTDPNTFYVIFEGAAPINFATGVVVKVNVGDNTIWQPADPTAPFASNAVADQVFTEGSGDQTVDVSGDFTNASSGTWSVTGTAATIDTSGVVTIDTTSLFDATPIAATYTNSIGAATSTFNVTVANVPDQMVAPTLTVESAGTISVDYDNETVDNYSTITQYDLRHSTDESTWTEVTDISDPELITGLTASTLYYVQTRAVNSIGNGSWSASASATTSGASAVPTYNGGMSDLSYENNIANQTYDFTQHFSNISAATWSISSTPTPSSGISINSSTGVATFEPLPLPEGTWSVTVTATDGSNSDDVTFNLSITAEAGTVSTPAPTYNGLAGNLTLTLDEAMTAEDLSVYFTGGDLTYSDTGTPTGLSLNTSTGVLTGTPTVEDVYAYTTTATNVGGTATASFNITVGAGGGGGGETSIESTDLQYEVSSGTFAIGTDETGRVNYFSVLAGGAESSTLTVGGSTATLVASDAYTNRIVAIYSDATLTGTTAAFSLSGTLDTEYLAAFKVIGYEPADTANYETGRRTGNDTQTTVLNCSVPTGGAVLLHGKRYDGVTGPTGTVVEEVDLGLRGYWENNTGSTAAVSFTFTTSTARAEKYGAALILKPSA